MTLAFREKDHQRIVDALPDLFKTCQAELLSDKVAHHEWENRFEIMVVKRLGPSLVPAEVVIPLSSLGDMMAEVDRKISQPVVKEGLVIREGAGGTPEVVILGFIPSDQRKFSYNFIFPLSLTIMKIAEKNGGRPYATGLYFAGKASQILGRERLERLKEFKARVDPGNILNPGKVMQGGLMASALSLGAAIEPLIRPLGNNVISKIGERPTQSVRDIPADVVWYAYTCSQCGYCVEECDQFYGRGWESQSPRGKWYWLREYMAGREQWDQNMVDTFLVCTTCEMCDTRCSTNLPIEPSWMKLRGMLINEEQRMTFPPFEMMAAALKSEGNIWAGYRKDRMDWYPEDLKAAHPPGGRAKNVYFAGCTASYVEHDIGQASVRLLDKAGVDFVHLGKEENCCGTPMLVAGRWDLFAEIMKRNIELVKRAGADTVIASCPACDLMWRQYYPEWAKKLGIDYPIKARHYSEILAEQIKAGKFRFPKPEKPVTVTWHDSCHIGRASGVYEPPRDVIQAIPDVKLVELSHNREQAHCCASVLTLLKEPAVAADIGKVKLDEALAAGAEKILSLCPCCQVQLRVTADKKGVPIEVQDLAHFAAATFGYTFPDPNPEVRKQWAVFDAFIKLLTPQGFADLMGTMWPELIDAMPFGMGRMMRLFGKVPGVLSLMKPMFPVLFPRLMPLMLPKVMATMLRRVEEHIEMPKYMREQMPDLMPKVMDRLMPHMICDVVPLITQPMIDYLQGKS
jgi:Fe-S oxidoreductase